MEGRKEGEQRQRHRRENKRTNGKRRQWMWRLINTATVSFVRVDRLIERLDDHSIGYFLSCSVNQWLLSIPPLSKAIMEAASNLSSYLYRSQLIAYLICRSSLYRLTVRRYPLSRLNAQHLAKHDAIAYIARTLIEVLQGCCTSSDVVGGLANIT